MQYISPEQQVDNVRACALSCVRKLREAGKSVRDAKRIVERRGLWARTSKGRQRRALIPWLADALEAVDTLQHWREIRAAYRAGLLSPKPEDGCPF